MEDITRIKLAKINACNKFETIAAKTNILYARAKRIDMDVFS